MASTHKRSLTPRENALLAYNCKVPEWVPIEEEDFFRLRPSAAIENGSLGTNGFDWFGVSWTSNETTGLTCLTPGVQRLKTLENWRKELPFPDLDKIDWKKHAQEDMAGRDKDKCFFLFLSMGLFERLHALMGVDVALMTMFEEPELVSDFFESLADFKIATMERIREYYNPDVFSYHDDWGTQRNLFFSPQLYRDVVKKPTARIVKAAKEMGFIFSMHCCGKAEALAGDMYEIGCNAWEMQYMNDQAAVKAKYGDKLAASATFDVEVSCNPNVDEQVLRDHVRNAIETLAPGGGYIPHIVTITPKRNVEIIIDTIHKYGDDFYR